MKKLIRFGGLALILLVAALIYNARQNARSVYELELEAERKQKNQDFSLNEDLPFAKMGDFKGLHYYEPKPDYKVKADFVLNTLTPKVELGTNTGAFKPYIQLGKAEFKLNGQRCELLLYKDVKGEEQDLFLPFKDATNGKETYGSGRFLDVELVMDAKGGYPNHVILDFNKAYNPYCAYDTAYICPMPPAENRLLVEVEAGEKLWAKH